MSFTSLCKTSIRRFCASSSPQLNIGFIGLGKIGFAMANNICTQNKLLVYDLDQSQCSKLRDMNPQSIDIASSASEVASNSNTLITVLPNDQILRATVDTQIYEHQPADSVHISCSTISPETSRYLAELQYTHNRTHYISAPVFARPDGMARGEASIPISGGTAQLREKVVKPILALTSTGIYDFGDDVGAANVVKICGNFLIASAIESMSEAFTLAEKNNVDRVQLKEMLTKTIFDCLIYKGYGQRVAEFDHVPYENAHFALELGYKDVNLVNETAHKSKVVMPFASTLKNRYCVAMNKQREKLDWSAIALSVNEDAGFDMTEQATKCSPQTKTV